MNALFRAIRQWWYAWTGQTPAHEALFVESDPPQTMHPGAVYVVLENGQPWSVSLMCPCECGAEVHLNLLPDERPRWQVTQHWHGLISLHPSVWRTNGCRAHFWFRQGRIHWCQHQAAEPTVSSNHWTA